jgi:hypothetical protein
MEQRSFVLSATTMESVVVFCFAGHHNGICSTCCLFSSAMLLTFVVDWFLLMNNALVSDQAFDVVICAFVFFEVGKSMQINLKITF